MTQMSWLNAQKREHLEATYQRMKQAANIQPLESEGSEERSIGEFESPPQLLHQQYQQYQQGYYDNSSQNIEDGSQHPQTPQMPAAQSDMSHPGF